MRNAVTPQQIVNRDRDFREDVNGLRAWAVIAVVAYHFRINGFSGGFVGVDIFFVISGFLMTSIVVTGLEREGLAWSVRNFYFARARRILPALLALCFILLVLGWQYLLPSDYKMLATHAVVSLTFVSNIKYFFEASYFDVASHEKWLLHTWSLSVEWQFYLLLPLMLMLVWRMRPTRRAVLVVFVVGAGTSLAAAIWWTPLQPTLSFYWLPTRAWEMLVGGVVFLLKSGLNAKGHRGKVYEAIGLTLILVSVLSFDATSPWPGWRALLPVIGSALVLLAQRPTSLWTTTLIAQWIGQRSYSLYLWHWPAVVALTYVDRVDDVTFVVIALAVTTLLADLSYRFVEMPTRRQKYATGKLPTLQTVTIVSALAIVTFSVFVRLGDGITDPDNKNVDLDRCLISGGVDYPGCSLKGPTIRAVLVGDSHAAAIASSISSALPLTSDGLLAFTYQACPPVFGIRYPAFMFARGLLNPENRCSAYFAKTVERIADLPKTTPVILASRASAYAFGHNENGEFTRRMPWVYFSHLYETPEPQFLTEYRARIVESACQFAKDRTVFMMRPIPEMGVDVPRKTFRALMLGRDADVSISLQDYRQRHAVVWAAQDEARERCGVELLDPLPYLCWDGRCHGTKDGRPLYLDDDHLNEYGSKLLVPMFREALVKLR